MFQSIRRFGSFALLATLMLALLAACGGSADTAASPEDRVKGFINDFSSALSDPTLSETATRLYPRGELLLLDAAFTGQVPTP